MGVARWNLRAINSCINMPTFHHRAGQSSAGAGIHTHSNGAGLCQDVSPRVSHSGKQVIIQLFCVIMCCSDSMTQNQPLKAHYATFLWSVNKKTEFLMQKQ